MAIAHWQCEGTAPTAPMPRGSHGWLVQPAPASNDCLRTTPGATARAAGRTPPRPQCRMTSGCKHFAAARKLPPQCRMTSGWGQCLAQYALADPMKNRCTAPLLWLQTHCTQRLNENISSKSLHRQQTCHRSLMAMLPVWSLARIAGAIAAWTIARRTGRQLAHCRPSRTGHLFHMQGWQLYEATMLHIIASSRRASNLSGTYVLSTLHSMRTHILSAGPSRPCR